MINDHAHQTVRAAHISPTVVKPLYDSYCFSQIPLTIVHLLTGAGDSGLPADVLGDFPRRYQRIILLFVDAFGWRFFERCADQYPFLKRFLTEGVVSKLTTQFPSTTAAHATSLHTGLPVGQTGVYEWNYYEPILDRVITPLQFCYAGDEQPETIKLPRGVSARHLFPDSTLYQRLRQQGVKTYLFQPRDISYGTYSAVMTAGAEVVPYKTLAEALIRLGDAALDDAGPACLALYWGDIDSICHQYGPSSQQFDAEVDTFFTALERLLHANLVGKLKNTLLLMIADHGQIEVSPQTTVYLNQIVPGLRRLLRTNDDGQLLVPAGSPRDMFLYMNDEALDDACDLLRRHPQLSDKAEIYQTRDLVEQGYFGTPSDALLERLGNVVILPRPGETVWWYRKGKFEQKFYGHHGGLTPAEMETLLLALPYGE